ncbi:unnamed protein product, partial [Ectocarpus fasciculatus]
MFSPIVPACASDTKPSSTFCPQAACDVVFEAQQPKFPIMVDGHGKRSSGRSTQLITGIAHFDTHTTPTTEVADLQRSSFREELDLQPAASWKKSTAGNQLQQTPGTTRFANQWYYNTTGHTTV